MKLLYLSAHSILEFDEVKLFTEMGIDVFSMGAYANPNAPVDIKRPGFTANPHEHLNAVAIQCSKDNIHPELIEWADVIMVMHVPDWITKNWEQIKKKKVVWRSIGQSIPDIESQLALPHSQGLKLVRYSPAESNIPGFIGQDTIIRFYKDPEEFKDCNGTISKVITVSQSMKKRSYWCHFKDFDTITVGFNRVVFGPNNEDIDYSGGLLSFEDLKKAYQDNRVYFYTGTYPASYTLNFIEAMMTGIPVVAIGPKRANIELWKGMNTYEVHQIIKHGENGFCSDDFDELRGNVDYLLSNPDKGKEIGERGRQTAIELFGKETVKKQWEDFFKTL